MKKFIYLFIPLCILLVAFFLRNYSNKNQVILKSDGFHPSELTVKKGTTVIFKTSLKKQFWPASNFHPTHELYPEFDPQKPIEPKETWEFKFDKVGEWKFHDHLSPNMKGTIIVLDENGKKSSLDCTNLKSVDSRTKQSCWVNQIDSVLSKEGLNSAFKLISELYNNDPDFSKICHDTMHRVGAAAYREYKQKHAIVLDPSTTFCSFGFYHGFTEAIAENGGNPNDAIKFCQMVGSQLGKDLPDIILQCHHGLGHGSVVVDNKLLWENEKAMIEPAKNLCLATSTDSQQLFRCGTGVFDSISIAYFSKSYGLTMKKDDPFWLCKEQKEEEFKKACYVSLDVALMWMNNRDLAKSAKYIESISEDEYAVLAMGSLALPAVNIRTQTNEETALKMENYYFTDGRNICNSLQKRLQSACITSIAYALTVPEGESDNYKKALKFCHQSKLSEDKANDCFRKIMETMAVIYPSDKIQQICQGINDEDRRKICL
ncbi:cupredoxin domain-containing protein [Candidatus Daviesbacteria bacterium]|nr:cupredoxin domain-containing protein [Candidatus Daviesbacteria bacterium]